LRQDLGDMLYLRLYRECLQRTFAGLRKSPWTLALPVFYMIASAVAAMLLAPLGMVGGFLMTIVATMCMASSLYFIGQTVLGSPSRIDELPRSFGFFWPVMSFGFVLWISMEILRYALAANPKRDIIFLGVAIVSGVLLNVVPEVIYQKDQVNGLSIIGESAGFVQKHWIEWFIPTGILAALVVALSWGLLLVLPPSLAGFGAILLGPVAGVLGWVVAVFRGNLFHALDTTSPYQLKMRYGARR
jgi:hypothetical protein